MYCYSKTSGRKVVHKNDCYHLRRTPKEKKGWFYTLEEAQAAGYRLCRNCSRAAEKYQSEKEEIERFCSQNEIACHTQDETIVIVTPYSKWKIIFAGGRMFLYHKNSQKRVSDRESPVPGYHSQAVHEDTIIAYLRYVIKHDEYRFGEQSYVQREKIRGKKGTKRYNKAKQQRKREHRYEVRRVLNLIDSLSEYDMARAVEATLYKQAAV